MEAEETELCNQWPWKVGGWIAGYTQRPYQLRLDLNQAQYEYQWEASMIQSRINEAPWNCRENTLNTVPYDYESNQQDATMYVNLLFLVNSTRFGRFSPIIGSTWLYLQYLVVFTQVAAGWFEARLTNHIVHFQLIQDTSQQQLGWILPDTVNTVKCAWW